MATGSSQVSRSARIALASMVIAATALIALVIASSSPASLKAQSAVSKAQSGASNSAAASAASQAAAIQKAKGMIATMPSYFEANQGQTDPSVKYLSRSGRYSMYLTDDATIISMVGGQIHKGPTIAMSNPPAKPDADRLVESAVRIRLVGANPHPKVTGLEPLPGRVNYLIGDVESKWHTNIPTFGRVKFAGVYPGVDVIHYGIGDTLEYDIVAAPGADTSAIKLAIEGNANTVTDTDGNLQIMTPAGVVVMHKPSVYQQSADGSRMPVGGSFDLAKKGTIERGVSRREVKIQLAAYDHSRELVIDPVSAILVYSSYIGGTASSRGPVNLEGFGALTGGSPLQVADVGLDVALDSSNDAYVTGVAYSKNFPTTPGAFQTALNGAHTQPNQNPNAFVAKFVTTMANNASLVYATYLGGSGDTVVADAGNGDGDLAFGIAVDAGNQAFVVGQTYSSGTDTTTGFPGTHLCGAFGQANNQGVASTNVGFISKLNSTGSGVVFSCYIDGSDNATESRVVLSPAGCGATALTECKAYMSGSTQSTAAQGFPVTSHAFQKDLLATGGKSNATFIVVHPDGQSLDYATYYGGTGNGTNADAGIAVAVDSGGKGYITGATFSTDLSLVNAAFSSYLGGGNTPPTSNVFVAEFDPTKMDAASLLYATYLGGHGASGTITITFPPLMKTLTLGDVGDGIVVDPTTGIWVSGLTASTDFGGIPGTVGTSFQSHNEAGSRTDCTPTGANPPASAAFVMQLDPTKTTTAQVQYSTYFGGCGIKVPAPMGNGSGSIGFGDAALDLKVLGDKVYLTGATTSGTATGHDFPISPNPLACTTPFRLDDNQSAGFSFGGGLVSIPITAFASELDTAQLTAPAELIFSALLGGTGTADIGGGIAVDSTTAHDIYVAGLTYSTDYPITPNAFQFANRGNKNSSTNAFLTEINPAGVTCPTVFPTPTPTATATGATATPTPTTSATATGSATPTATATATKTATPTATATATGSATATATATKTATPTATATATGSATATATKTATPTATATSTGSATATATATKTATPTATATATATATPTATPTPAGAPGISVSPHTLSLSAPAGTSTTGTVTITNTGTGSLTGSVGSPGGAFSITGGGGAYALTGGMHEDVTVKFTAPTKKGKKKSGFTVTNNAGKKHKPVKVKLKGKST
jgi:hypothetical protein